MGDRHQARRPSRPARSFKGRNFKLLVDSAIVKGSARVYRVDGFVSENSPANIKSVEDPRPPLTRWPSLNSEALDLPVPRLRVDRHYVGKPPQVEVTVTNLNDNIDRQFLFKLVARFGEVSEMKVFHHPVTHKHLGIARVVFYEVSDANTCVSSLNGRSVMGKNLNAFLDAFGKECKKMVSELTSQNKPQPRADNEKQPAPSDLQKTDLNLKFTDEKRVPSHSPTKAKVRKEKKFLKLSASENVVKAFPDDFQAAAPQLDDFSYIVSKNPPTDLPFVPPFTPHIPPPNMSCPAFRSPPPPSDLRPPYRGPPASHLVGAPLLQQWSSPIPLQPVATPLPRLMDVPFPSRELSPAAGDLDLDARIEPHLVGAPLLQQWSRPIPLQPVATPLPRLMDVPFPSRELSPAAGDLDLDARIEPHLVGAPLLQQWSRPIPLQPVETSLPRLMDVSFPSHELSPAAGDLDLDARIELLLKGGGAAFPFNTMDINSSDAELGSKHSQDEKLKHLISFDQRETQSQKGTSPREFKNKSENSDKDEADSNDDDRMSLSSISSKSTVDVNVDVFAPPLNQFNSMWSHFPPEHIASDRDSIYPMLPPRPDSSQLPPMLPFLPPPVTPSHEESINQTQLVDEAVFRIEGRIKAALEKDILKRLIEVLAFDELDKWWDKEEQSYNAIIYNIYTYNDVKISEDFSKTPRKPLLTISPTVPSLEPQKPDIEENSKTFKEIKISEVPLDVEENHVKISAIEKTDNETEDSKGKEASVIPEALIDYEHSYSRKKDIEPPQHSPMTLDHDYCSLDVWSKKVKAENSTSEPKKSPEKLLSHIKDVHRKSASTKAYRTRDALEEMLKSYEFLTKGVDAEDITYLKNTYDAEKQMSWLNTTHWVDYPVTDVHDKAQNELYHQTGCARTEGYYKIDSLDKQKHPYNKNKPLAALQGHGICSAADNKGVMSASREARNNQRRLLTAFGTDTDSDLLKFNQLKFRKKQLKFGKSEIHDWGLFSMETIAAEEMVIEYVGQRIRPLLADFREKDYETRGIGSSYLFRTDNDNIIDATRFGNLARFINHSCNPNCYAKIISIEGKKKIVIYSKRDIQIGEEITYDYKFPFEEKKILCLCGAINCKGFLN